MVGAHQNKWLTTPYSGMVVILGLALATINLSTEYEV